MPQTSWSNTDERQYVHKLGRGTSNSKAEEIAARTVNKRRRIKGRTPNRRTRRTGNPNLSLEERTLDEVNNLAKELNQRALCSPC